jgi:hypothetical protein
MSEEASPPSGLRASDEDRELVVSALRDHAVAGRLSTDELEQRLQAAYTAQTTAELDAVRRDLPASPREAALTHAARRSQLVRRVIQETGGLAAVFVVCTAIWLASGASGQFWPVWILIIVVLSLARNGWALFGPAADLDAVERQLNRKRQLQSETRSQELERRRQRRWNR